MAIPLKDEDKIYAQLKEEGIKVDKRVWALIDHHVRNDLNRISVSLGLFADNPDWILNAAGWLIRFLHRISFQRGAPVYEFKKFCRIGIQATQDISVFLRNLRSLTLKKD